MAWKKPEIVENVTKATKAFFEVYSSGIEGNIEKEEIGKTVAALDAHGAVQSALTIENNIAVGKSAAKSLTTGTFNTAIGFEALPTATSVIGNSAVGYKALHSLTETPVGEYEKGRYNVAFGPESMYAATIASYNSGIAPLALRRLTTGLQNVALGFNTMTMLETGSYNVGLGTEALASIKTTLHNTAVGTNAAIYATGSSNVALGQGALHGKGHESGEEFIGESSGSFNTAIGTDVMVNFTTGAQNSALGENSLESLTTGSANVAIGNASISKLTTGGANAALGYKAGLKATVGSSENVFLGYEAGPTTEGAINNHLYIHNAQSNEPLIWGIFGERILQFNTKEMGFYKKTPVVQPSEVTGTGGYTEVGGSTIKSESTFTGGIGTKKYTFGGIVKSLKEVGLIAE